MHSRIYQIEKESDYELKRFEPSEDMVMSVNFNVDYFGVSDNLREDDLKWLDSNLPEGMFEREGDKLTYKKFPKFYIEEKLKNIKEMAKNLTFDDILTESINLYRFGQEATGRSSAMLVANSDITMDRLDSWWLWVAHYYKLGETFKIGTIYDYHC